MLLIIEKWGKEERMVRVIKRLAMERKGREGRWPPIVQATFQLGPGTMFLSIGSKPVLYPKVFQLGPCFNKCETYLIMEGPNSINYWT